MKKIIAKQSNRLNGTAHVPGDKSISHRSLMFAAIAEGTSKITGILEGEDVISTANALSAMGAKIVKNPGYWQVEGVGKKGLKKPDGDIYLGNSGTSARLLMGLVGGYPLEVTFSGDPSLSKRPMGRVTKPLEQMGVEFEAEENNKLPLKVIGKKELNTISYKLPVASAQVKSAILLAGLHAKGTTTIIEPLPTRDHTELMLSAMGANIQSALQEDGSNIVTIEGFPDLSAQDIEVPSDPSSAAFIAVAALITANSEVIIPNVLMNKRRTGLYNTLIEMGANIIFKNMRSDSRETVADLHVKSSKLKGVSVPAERVPSMIDEFPILSVAASFAEGKTIMTDLAELRVKESDRLTAIAKGLTLAGVKLEEGEDRLTVYGTNSEIPKGGCTIESNFDHRIAMSFAVMGLATQEPIEINEAETISTSFPNFIELVKSLGGNLG